MAPKGFIFVLIILVVGVPIGLLLRFLFVRLVLDREGPECAAPAEPAKEQDRQMVMEMLRDDKVSGDQAAELMKALGSEGGPVDKLPLSVSTLGAVGGALVIVIGFMLPWAYVQLSSPMFGFSQAYQSGRSVGAVGWLVLIAGLLPAILVCIPALDKYVRHALLRVVISCIGIAFIISMIVLSPKGPGLWVTLVGFGLQLATTFMLSDAASSLRGPGKSPSLHTER